jgi:hypothetical protein
MCPRPTSVPGTSRPIHAYEPGEELLDDYITEDGEPLTMADALEFVDKVNRYGHMASAEELELARELASVFHGHMEETQAAAAQIDAEEGAAELMGVLLAQHGEAGPVLLSRVLQANGGDLEAALGPLDQQLGPAPAGNDLDSIANRFVAENRLVKGGGRWDQETPSSPE